MQMNRKRLAVVTPHHRFPLTADENLSLNRLREFFGGFDRYLVCAESATHELHDFHVIRVPDGDLASEWAYNRLLLSRRFYEWFASYDYILIYQLDCLAFSGDILPWCDQGWDYVGAPWFQDYGNDPTEGFFGVGNGGFSLRKVQSHLDVFSSRVPGSDPVALGWRNSQVYRWGLIREVVCRFMTILHRFGYRNRIQDFLVEYCRKKTVHEDIFWSREARRFKPGFRIPTPQQALSFAFECAPRACFEANGRQLPLGCHAWAKYDRSFWEDVLQSEVGEELVERIA